MYGQPKDCLRRERGTTVSVHRLHFGVVFCALSLLLWLTGCIRSGSRESGPTIGAGGFAIKTIATLGEQDPRIGDLAFGHIADLEIDSENRILVADSSKKSLRRLTTEGETLWSLDTQGHGPGEVRIPWLVTALRDQFYLFDIGKKRIMVAGIEDAEPRHEISLPFFLYGMVAEREQGFFSAGVADADFTFVEQQVFHHFDPDGSLLASYSLERPFYAEGAPSLFAKQMIFQYYSGRAAIESYGEHLLISPVFDRASYLMTRTGETLRRFENTHIDVPHLSYEAAETGVTFTAFESVSGPALPMPDGRILKGYQVAHQETLQFEVDLFAADGTLLASRISVPGLPMAVGGDGRIYAVRNLPYSQILILEMTEPENEKLFVDTDDTNDSEDSDARGKCS